MNYKIKTGWERGKPVLYINVKCYDSYRLNKENEKAFINKYKLKEEYEEVLEKAWDLTQHLFWEHIQQLCEGVLWDTNIKVYQSGRSGGWVSIYNYLCENDLDENDQLKNPVQITKVDILEEAIRDIIRIEFSEEGILNRLQFVLFSDYDYDIDTPLIY